MLKLSLKKSILFLCLVAVVAILFFVFTTPSYGAPQELSGWGWSSNIGWVSFSKQSVTSPSGPQFGVSLDDTSGDITGYAWSDSVGWLSFNPSDLAPCTLLPEDQGSKQARVLNMAGGGTREVVGWARFLTGNTAQAGGWDGCVHLSSGSVGNHPTGVSDGSRGVTLIEIPDGTGTKDMFVGFAWGGEVVGWLDFAPFLQKPGGGTPPPCPNCGGGGGCVGICSGGGGGTTVVLTANGANPLVVTNPNDPFLVVLAWTVTGNTPDHCTATNDWSGSKNVSGDTESFNLANPGSYSFRLDCFDSSNVLIGSDTVPVTLSTGGGCVGCGLTVNCQAFDADGNATTTVPIGEPVTWRAVVNREPTDPNFGTLPPGTPVGFAWFNSPSGSPVGLPGFSSIVNPSDQSVIIEIQRTYTTLGTKSVYIEITGTNDLPPLTGSCVATPAMVNVRTKPIIQPF